MRSAPCVVENFVEEVEGARRRARSVEEGREREEMRRSARRRRSEERTGVVDLKVGRFLNIVVWWGYVRNGGRGGGKARKW